MTVRRCSLAAIANLLALAPLMAQDKEPAERLDEAAAVFSEIMAATDTTIPEDLLGEVALHRNPPRPEYLHVVDYLSRAVAESLAARQRYPLLHSAISMPSTRPAMPMSSTNRSGDPYDYFERFACRSGNARQKVVRFD